MLTTRLPSIVAEVAAVVPPELKLKPVPKSAGKVTTTLPSAGMGLDGVKLTVTSPETPATKEAGSTLVELSKFAIITIPVVSGVVVALPA